MVVAVSEFGVEFMFLDHFGLQEQPFGVTPDPRYLFWSRSHREAMASLYYGIESDRGFVALIAPPGMGKTTLLFHLLERLRPTARTVFLFQTLCTASEFLRFVMADLGCDTGEEDVVALHGRLNKVLAEVARDGKRFVLVIDEAQNLDDSVLETIRLLSDFETPSRKLMQIILAGQPQLAEKLARPELAQLRQRIAITSRLDPLATAEVEEYIANRLQVAGYDGGPVFTPEAMALLAARSRGIPRVLNHLCFNAFSLAFARHTRQIDKAIAAESVSDLDAAFLDRPENTGIPSACPVAPKPRARSREAVLPLMVRLPDRRALVLAISLAVALLAGASIWVSLMSGIHAAGAGTVQASAPLPAAASPAVDGAGETRPVESGSMSAGGMGAPEPGASAFMTMTVAPGETLWSISRRHVGRNLSPEVQDEILRMNPQISDPNRILFGTNLRLPAPERR
jgi:type II secretory pathway predicted ATPase ExeA